MHQIVLANFLSWRWQAFVNAHYAAYLVLVANRVSSDILNSFFGAALVRYDVAGYGTMNFPHERPNAK